MNQDTSNEARCIKTNSRIRRKKKKVWKKTNNPENLTVQINGGPPEKLNLQNAIKIIQIQSQDIQKLKARIEELEKQI